MRARSAVVVLLLATGTSSAALDVSLERYATARRSGELGAVTGRAYAERRVLREADRPLEGTTVTLLPRSEALLARLEEFRRHARDSLDTYRTAVTAMRLVREAYEAALWDAGAPDLVRTTLVDAEGRFRFDALPAGAWTLMAMHSVYVDVRATKAGRREQGLYRLGPRVVGYRAVTVWLRDVVVTGGGSEAVELTDRNGWFSGIVEETTPGAGH